MLLHRNALNVIPNSIHSPTGDSNGIVVIDAKGKYLAFVL